MKYLIYLSIAIAATGRVICACVRGQHGSAHTRVHRMPWQGGPRRPGRLLPANCRQARRLPVQPVAELPRRPPPLWVDGTPAGSLVRRYLLEIAQHFASLDLPYPRARAPDVPAALLERGRVLALQGDEAAKVPACVQCHGAALTGVVPNTPWPARALPRLPQRPTGRVEDRPASCACAGLHGADRPATAAGGSRRCHRLAGGPTAACRYEARACPAPPPTITCGSATLPAGRQQQ
jgi:cytochrome c553